MLAGEVVCRYKNGEGFTYRIKLDMKWNDRVAACGESIVIGNVQVGRLFPESGT